MPPILLDEVPATQLIFENPDQDGNFHFPNKLSYRGPSGPTPLTDRQIIALAVTEFCSRNGRGKVLSTLFDDTTP